MVVAETCPGCGVITGILHDMDFGTPVHGTTTPTKNEHKEGCPYDMSDGAMKKIVVEAMKYVRPRNNR